MNAVEAEATPETAEPRPAPEAGAEKTAEAAEMPQVATAKVEMPEGPPPEQKDPYRMQVERLLEDNLWEVYKALPQGPRMKFKAKGETLAQEMRGALGDPKAKAGQIFADVRDWLKTIPNVNPFFLSQEAKIKTDKWARIRKDMAEAGDTMIEEA